MWKKQNILEGKTLNYVNKYFEADAREYGFYSEDLMDYLAGGGSLQTRSDVPTWVKKVYITAPEIGFQDHILMQAAFQQHVDSGISKTINFDNSATHNNVADAYSLAWKTGCKGVTIYRAGSRDKEVLVKGTEKSITEEQLEFDMSDVDVITKNDCCENPYVIQESGCETCKTCGWSACVIA